jgi:hypothetical protein
MWGILAGLVVITFTLGSFIVPGDLTRLFVLTALWLILLLVLDIIISLMIINRARFSKPDESAGAERLQ